MLKISSRLCQWFIGIGFIASSLVFGDHGQDVSTPTPAPQPVFRNKTCADYSGRLKYADGGGGGGAQPVFHKPPSGPWSYNGQPLPFLQVQAQFDASSSQDIDVTHASDTPEPYVLSLEKVTLTRRDGGQVLPGGPPDTKVTAWLLCKRYNSPPHP